MAQMPRVVSFILISNNHSNGGSIPIGAICISAPEDPSCGEAGVEAATGMTETEIPDRRFSDSLAIC